MDTLLSIVRQKGDAFHDREALKAVEKLPFAQLYFHAQEMAERAAKGGTDDLRRMRALAEYEIARRQRVALERLTRQSTWISAMIGAAAAIAGGTIGGVLT